MRFLLVLLMVCGCQEDGGAVSVRWQIFDLTTGTAIKPTDAAGPDGSCVRATPNQPGVGPWHIARVRLVIADPTTDVEVLSPTDPRLLFNCSQREATTPFSLPLGTFALSLRAVNQGMDDPTVVTPAPSLRTLKRAELVNLDVVELGIHGIPLAPFDGGVTDLAEPDGGPEM